MRATAEAVIEIVIFVGVNAALLWKILAGACGLAGLVAAILLLPITGWWWVALAFAAPVLAPASILLDGRCLREAIDREMIL